MVCKPVPFKLTVPPLCVKVPLLEKLPAKFRVPDVEVRVPALMLSPFSVTVLLPKLRVPAPALVKVLVASEMAPPSVSVFAVVVICRAAFMLIAPAPRFKLFVPVKVKSAFKAKG